MKKLNFKALTLPFFVAIIVLLPFSTTAQGSDGFFRANESENYQNRADSFGLSNQPFGTEAPVGSGLLVMAIAGAGYVALKRKRSYKTCRSYKTYMLALAMVLAFTGCKKKIEPIVNSGETAHITLNVGNGNRHIIEPNENGYVPVSYSAGDVIYVGNGSTYIGTLSYVEEQGNVAKFEGDVNPAPNKDDMLHFYFIGGLDPSVTPEQGTTTDFTVDISNQSSKLPVLSYISAPYNGDNPINCMLKNKCALVEFKFENGTGNKATKISNMLCEAKIDFANGCITPTEKLDAIALYNDPNDNDKKVKWAILLFGGARKSMGMVYRETQVYQTQNIDLYDYYDGVNVPLLSENNNYLYGSSAISVNNNVDNVNNKVFVVSANGNAVRFAHGNLKCTKTGDNWSDGHTWSFMDNQYDYVETNAKTYCTDDYGDKDAVSLFGWGCTGVQDAMHNGNQTRFMPYNTTVPSWTTDCYGPTGFNDLSVLNGSDWGAVVPNAEGYNWRVLTQGEWDYVLNTRYNCRLKRRFACVSGTTMYNGRLLLSEGFDPYEFSGGDGTITFATKKELDDFLTNTNYDAVFLPFSGYRNVNKVDSKASTGRYWASTQKNSSNLVYYTCYVNFTNGAISITSGYRAYGYSVRLVR